MCLRYAASRDEALEILNEGFLKVFTSLNNYNNTGSFEGWVRRIIFHTALDAVRTRLRYKEEPVAGIPVAAAVHALEAAVGVVLH